MKDEMTAPHEKGVYRRALAYFAPDWPWIAVLVFGIGVNVIVGLLEAWPLAILVDRVLTRDPKGDWIHDAFMAFMPDDKIGQIIGLVLVGLGLQIVGYASWAMRMMINYHLNYWGTTRVRFDLFRKLQALGLTYHRSRPQGDSIYRLTTDASGPWGVTDIVIGTSVAGITLVVMTTILVSRNLWLTLAAFSVAPFIIWSNWQFGLRIHQRALASKQIDADLTAHIQQAMTRVPLAQAYRREHFEFERFGGAVGRSVQALIRLNWQEQLYPLARDAILAVGAAIILGYGGYLVYRDQFISPVAGGMTVGTLIIFMDYLRKLWDPLKWLTEFVAKVRIFEAASRRVFRVLDEPEPISDGPEARPLPRAGRTLHLDRIAFRYDPNGPPILQNVSVLIRPGEMVAFVGPSGSGKSTLLNLLLRYYDPTEGALRLDTTDFRSIVLSDLRAHMALVTQDNLILPTSIGENIRYGRPAASGSEIAAARLAGAAQFIEELPDRYETILAEGGSNLSGGQRQRIAIARALVTDSPILILDEPTSALDPDHERRLIETLHELKRLRTIVLVTHRLESVVDCDQIFVLQSGQIVERGTHCELIANSGTYSKALHTQRASAH